MLGSTNQIVLGCLVGIISLATQSIGLTLQRKSHLMEDAKPATAYHRPSYKRPIWQLGCLLFIMSNVVGSSIQISTLPLIILSPLQAVGLVFNSICGSLILNEVFTHYTLLGTVFVSIGAFFIAYFGSIPEPNHNLQELLELMRRKYFVIWLYLSIAVLISVLVYISLLGFYLSRHQDKTALSYLRYSSISQSSGVSNTSHGINPVEVEEVRSEHVEYSESSPLLSYSTPILSKDAISISIRPVSACSSTFSDISHKVKNLVANNKLFSSFLHSADFVHKDNIPLLQGILYGIVCGILSAHALLLAKSAVELVIVAIIERAVADIKSYQSWLIISGWIFCAIMQVYYLNLGLKIISSSIMLPLIFCVYNMVNILNGLIYFDQFNKLTVTEIVMIFTGVILILCGVSYLSINDIIDHHKSVPDVEDLEERLENQPRLPSESFDAGEEADVVPPLNTTNGNNVKSLSINTQFSQYDASKSQHQKTHWNTPSLTASKPHSIYTNSSLNPILSESFTSHKLHLEDDKL